jgi:hypothetical protein
MSVAREREMGTFDQLLVSPMQRLEITAGKSIPEQWLDARLPCRGTDHLLCPF